MPRSRDNRNNLSGLCFWIQLMPDSKPYEPAIKYAKELIPCRRCGKLVAVSVTLVSGSAMGGSGIVECEKPCKRIIIEESPDDQD